MSEHVTITLPDGATRDYERGVTGAEVAADISKSLGKSALACRIDGALSDLSRPIEKDADLAIVTAKDQPEALELIRHDCAHIMARAVQELFQGTKVTIGPVIEHGFYYAFARDDPFTEDDFAAIEKRMREIIAARDPVRPEVWSREDALHFYGNTNEPYKVELIEHPPRRADPDVLARPLAGPVPGPSSATYRPGSGGRLQADVGGRGLLARRQPQPDAAAHLWGGVQEQGRPQGPSPHAGGGRQA